MAKKSETTTGVVAVRLLKRGICMDGNGKAKHRGRGFEGFVDGATADHAVGMGSMELRDHTPAPKAPASVEAAVDPEEAANLGLGDEDTAT